MSETLIETPTNHPVEESIPLPSAAEVAEIERKAAEAAEAERVTPTKEESTPQLTRVNSAKEFISNFFSSPKKKAEAEALVAALEAAP